MPRFHFDLLGACAVHDQQGMLLEDCEVADRHAEKMATDLGAVRLELHGKTFLVMTDKHRNGHTYCVAIGNSPPPRQPIHGRIARGVCLMLEGPIGSGFPL
jgi:hypothetical protein